MRVEQAPESGRLGVGEGVAAPQQSEAGSEHLGLEGRLDAVGLSALDVAARRGGPCLEPSDGVEAVQDVAGVPEPASMAAL